MTYLASKLISKAYYLSKIVSHANQTLTPAQVETGIDLLNEVLAEKAINPRLIPYYKEYSVTAVVGQEKYFIPGLVVDESFTFKLNSVRYGSQNLTRKEYNSVTRADGINSMPFRWHVERAYESVAGVMTTGANLYIYFTPNMNYPMKIWGKFALDAVTLNTDMSLVYDSFYMRYLRYALSPELSAEWDYPVTPDVSTELQRIETLLNELSPPDFTPIRLNLYDERNVINYAQINISPGSTP